MGLAVLYLRGGRLGVVGLVMLSMRGGRVGVTGPVVLYLRGGGVVVGLPLTSLRDVGAEYSFNIRGLRCNGVWEGLGI